MNAEKVKQLVKEYKTFIITYYAKKHGKIINRQGTWTKPNTDILGKHLYLRAKTFLSIGISTRHQVRMAIRWRHATNPSVRVA
jgi:hypothetical protein